MIIDGIKYKKTHLEAKRLARVRRWDRKLTFRANYLRRLGGRVLMWNWVDQSKYKPHQGAREKARRLRQIDKIVATTII